MAPQDLLRHVNMIPLKPLRINVADGASYDATGRFQAHVFPIESAVGLDPDPSGLPTRAVYIAPTHVTRVERIPATRT